MSHEAAGKRIIVYDSACRLCRRAAAFFRSQYKGGRCEIISRDSEAGRAILHKEAKGASAPDAIVFVEDQKTYTGSSAIIRIMRQAPRLRLLAGIIALVPERVRDVCYDLVAKNRHRWFGAS